MERCGADSQAYTVGSSALFSSSLQREAGPDRNAQVCVKGEIRKHTRRGLVKGNSVLCREHYQALRKCIILRADFSIALCCALSYTEFTPEIRGPEEPKQRAERQARRSRIDP